MVPIYERYGKISERAYSGKLFTIPNVTEVVKRYLILAQKRKIEDRVHRFSGANTYSGWGRITILKGKRSDGKPRRS
jgi:hypothetical protein